MSYDQLAESVDNLVSQNSKIADAVRDAISRMANAINSSETSAKRAEQAKDDTIAALPGVFSLVSQTAYDQRAMYRRRIIHNLPMRGKYHDELYSTNGYTMLYPTGFVVDKSANQIIVGYGTTGGARFQAVWYVYDLTTGEFINCVIIDENVNESIVIRYEKDDIVSENNFEGATRYAYCTLSYDLAAAGRSNIAKVDLTNLESVAPMSILPFTTPVTGRTAFSWISWTGQEWIVQHYGRSNGRFRRFVFDRFTSDFKTRVGTIRTPFNFAGDTSGDAYGWSPKSQGFASLGGALYASIGAPFSYSGSASNSNPKLATKQYGISQVGPTGTGLRSALCQADKFLECISKHIDFVPTQCETEGLCANNGTLYNLFVLQNHVGLNATTRGLVLFEELSSHSDAIDFSPYGTTNRGVHDDVQFQTIIHSDDSPLGLCNPINGEAFTSIKQICAAMHAVGWSRYSFVLNGQTLLDMSNQPMNTASGIASIRNLDGRIFYLDIERATSIEKWQIDKDLEKQSRIGFTVAVALSSLPVDQSAVVVNDNTLGKISTYKNLNAAATHFEFWNQTPDGTAKQLAGYIRCNGLTTAYNTTSDATLKQKIRDFPKEKAREILKLIKIYGYNFIGETEERFGPFAQELYEVFPDAVTPGFWSAVNPETLEENKCQECEVAQYTPWAVDKSKLMDVIIVAMQDMEDRLQALESKLN